MPRQEPTSRTPRRPNAGLVPPSRFSKAMQWVIQHPIGAFIWATVMSLLIATALWTGSLYWLFADSPSITADRFSNSSGLVQAVIGTALAGASALVAILIATSATKIAESALFESKVTNQINDPDYLSAKAGLRGYQKYAFLMGELLAIFRLHQQERTQGEYRDAAIDTPVAGQDGARATHTMPAWNFTLSEMQALLFNTDFLSTAYDMARYLDDKRGVGQLRVWALRKCIAGMAATIERYLQPEAVDDPNTVLMHLMARAQLLNAEMRRTVNALKSGLDRDEPIDRAGYPNLHWLSAWLEQVPTLAVDRDFAFALERPLVEFHTFGSGGLPLAALIQEFMTEQDDSCGFSPQGTHAGALLATLAGDQATVLQAERCAEQAARSLGWQPMYGLPRRADAPNVFRIVTCRAEHLGALFNDSALQPTTRGCVIVDGVRAKGLPLVQTWADEHGQMPLASLDDFVREMVSRHRKHLLAVGNDAPRLFWIGIDYRKLGVTPAAAQDPEYGELWSILGRGPTYPGVDAAELLALEDDAVFWSASPTPG